MQSKVNLTKNKHISILTAIKIIIIAFASMMLLANFVPFYQGADSLIYGISSVNVANGSYEYTNELLDEYKGSPFIPHQFVKTNQGTAITSGGVGIYGIGAFFYLIGSYYGLFYLGPIFTILLLIFSERIATKLFGDLAGLVALVIIAFDYWIFNGGIRLLTDNIFALFLVLGCFYLIKFLREGEEKSILFSSIFLVASSLMRLNGMIFFPIEIMFVLGFFLIYFVKKSKNDSRIKNGKLGRVLTLQKNKAKIMKISVFLIIPWLLFFLFFFSYNAHYFAEPLTTYEEQRVSKPSIVSSSIKFDTTRVEWLRYYSVGFLPDTLTSNLLKITEYEPDNFFDKNWLSGFSFAILFSALGVALYEKKKRTEVIVMLGFISGSLLLFSSSYVSPPVTPELLNLPVYGPSPDTQHRYMIANLVLTSMLFGYLMNRVWKIKLENFSNNRKKTIKSVKIVFLIALSLFLLTTVLGSKQVQGITDSGFTYKNPVSFANRYPVDLQGLTENSVIVDSRSRRVLELGVIPFNPNMGISKTSGWNPDNINQKHIEILKTIINDGYDVYVFKNQRAEDVPFFKYIQVEKGIKLKNHSKTFCKMELAEIINGTDVPLIEPSDICLFVNLVIIQKIKPTVSGLEN